MPYSLLLVNTFLIIFYNTDKVSIVYQWIILCSRQGSESENNETCSHKGTEVIHFTNRTDRRIYRGKCMGELIGLKLFYSSIAWKTEVVLDFLTALFCFFFSKNVSLFIILQSLKIPTVIHEIVRERCGIYRRKTWLPLQNVDKYAKECREVCVFNQHSSKRVILRPILTGSTRWSDVERESWRCILLDVCDRRQSGLEKN